MATVYFAKCDRCGATAPQEDQINSPQGWAFFDGAPHWQGDLCGACLVQFKEWLNAAEMARCDGELKALRSRASEMARWDDELEKLHQLERLIRSRVESGCLYSSGELTEVLHGLEAGRR